MRTAAALILSSSCLALLAACAMDNRESKIVQDQREVVTGSRIPKRDRSDVSVMSRDEYERTQNSGGVGTRGADPK